MAVLKQDEKQYVTKDGDVVDRICYDYYGRVDGVTETVYLRNIETLRDYGAILPGGLLLVLPVITSSSPGIRLWNYRREQVFIPSDSASTERRETDSLLAEFQARSFWESGQITDQEVRDLINEERETRLGIEEDLTLRLAEVTSLLTSTMVGLQREVVDRQDSVSVLADQFSVFSQHYGQMLTDLFQQISAQGQQLQNVVEAGSHHIYEEFTVGEDGLTELPLSKTPKSAKMVFWNGLVQPPDFSVITSDQKLSIEGEGTDAIVAGDTIGVFYFY